MNTKTVYQGDEHGFFMGETTADESPLESGVWHIPRGAIEAQPPLKWSDSKWPQIRGSKWVLVNMPAAPEVDSPVAKLKAFLAANPDVVAAIKQGGV